MGRWEGGAAISVVASHWEGVDAYMCHFVGEGMQPFIFGSGPVVKSVPIITAAELVQSHSVWSKGDFHKIIICSECPGALLHSPKTQVVRFYGFAKTYMEKIGASLSTRSDLKAVVSSCNGDARQLIVKLSLAAAKCDALRDPYQIALELFKEAIKMNSKDMEFRVPSGTIVEISPQFFEYVFANMHKMIYTAESGFKILDMVTEMNSTGFDNEMASHLGVCIFNNMNTKKMAWNYQLEMPVYVKYMKSGIDTPMHLASRVASSPFSIRGCARYANSPQVVLPVDTVPVIKDVLKAKGKITYYVERVDFPRELYVEAPLPSPTQMWGDVVISPTQPWPVTRMCDRCNVHERLLSSDLCQNCMPSMSGASGSIAGNAAQMHVLDPVPAEITMDEIQEALDAPAPDEQTIPFQELMV